MDRNEAVTYLKELLNTCQSMSPQAVSFEKNGASAGFKVHIKGVTNEPDKEKIRGIAQKHSLAVEEESDAVVIYKP